MSSTLDAALPKASSPEGKPHLGWLDSLRALAALWVVGCHACAGTVAFRQSNPLTTVLFRFLNAGHYAVTLFIAISGYSLALSPSRNGWRLRDGYKAFLAARWLRIVPAYYAAIAFSLVMIAIVVGHKTGTHWDVSIPVHRKEIVEHLLLVQNLAGAPAINHAFWSIAVESQIYLFFGLYLWGMRKRGPLGTILVGVALSIVGVLLRVASLPLVHRGLLNDDRCYLGAFLLVFAFGVCACRTQPSMRDATPARRSVLWAIAAVLMAASSQAGVDLLYLPDVAFGLGASLVLSLLGSSSRVPRSMSDGPLPSIGRFSYSVYLTHAPVIQAVYVIGGVWRPMGPFWSSMGYLLVALPCAIGMGYLFYRACESPLAGARRFLRREDVARGPV